MVTPKQRPMVLVIRDGWGANPHREWDHANAVRLATTPVTDSLMDAYPHVQIATHGPDVGLPEGVMGNSEVGHQNIGAGRVVNQDLMIISAKIRDGSFFENKVLGEAFHRAVKSGGSVHLMGLCSDAGVHSALEHVYALLEFAKRVNFPPDRVFLHAFADGRDTPPHSGIDVIRDIESKMAELGVGRVATVIGRYYAMDRDTRWDRVESAYRLLTEGKGARAKTAAEAFQRYYDAPTDPNRVGDEFITATSVVPQGADGPVTIQDGDSVVFFNFRGDRPRELIKAFRFDPFPFEEKRGDDDVPVSHGFERGKPMDLYFATMTNYQTGLPVEVIVPPAPKMDQIFGDYLSSLGLKQFRCAETEKYPHVTFFFNDYREAPFDGEDRTIVPSPRDVATYDLKPEMSAKGVMDEVVSRIQSGAYDVIVVNFANGDMVGHTGNLQAAIKAVETVDACVGRVVEATLSAGGSLIVTADHGNCEQMIDPRTNQPHTSHTTYDVEMIVVGEHAKGRQLRAGGRLADICPTMLDMMGLDKPEAMTGRSLLI